MKVTPGALLTESLVISVWPSEHISGSYFSRVRLNTDTMVGEVTLVLEYGARASRYLESGWL